MKKFVFLLNVLLLMLFFNNSIYSSKLMEAIDTFDLEKVEKLVKDNQITQEEKTKLLNYLASLIDEAKISTKSIWNSKTDLARVLLGLFGTMNVGLPLTGSGLSLSIGGLIIYLITKNECRRPGNTDAEFANFVSKIAMLLGIPVTAFGGTILGLSVDQIRKGFNLFSAYRRLKRARQIETLIEEAVTKNN